MKFIAEIVDYFFQEAEVVPHWPRPSFERSRFENFDKEAQEAKFSESKVRSCSSLQRQRGQQDNAT